MLPSNINQKYFARVGYPTTFTEHLPAVPKFRLPNPFYIQRKNYLDTSSEVIYTSVPLHYSDLFNPSCFGGPQTSFTNLQESCLPNVPNYLKNLQKEILNFPNYENLNMKSDAPLLGTSSKHLELVSNIEKSMEKNLIKKNEELFLIANEPEKVSNAQVDFSEDKVHARPEESLDDTDMDELTKMKDQSYVGHVRFYNQLGACSHNFFLKYPDQKNKKIEVTKINKNSILIKFMKVETDKDLEIADNLVNIEEVPCDEQFQITKSNVISKFFSKLKQFSKNTISWDNFKTILHLDPVTEKFQIRYELLKKFLLVFFRNEDVTQEFEQLNKIELIFVGLILNKKKFRNWNPDYLEMSKLQESQSNKGEKFLLRLFISFLVQFLTFKFVGNSKAEQKLIITQFFKKSKDKKMWRTSEQSKTNVNTFFNYCFGVNRPKELRTLNSILKEISRKSESKFANDKSSKVSALKSKHLIKITTEIYENFNSKNLIHIESLNSIVREIYEFYTEVKLPEEIKFVVEELRSKMTNSTDQIENFLRYIIEMKKNSKFNYCWTFTELHQAKGIFERCINKD